MEAEGVDVNEDVFKLEAEELSSNVKEKSEREAMETKGVDVNEDVFQLEAEELSTEVEEKAEREAMEVDSVEKDEDVFQLEAEESSTKVEEKAESSETSPGADMKMVMAALSQFSSQLSAQLSSQMSQMASEISSQVSSQMSQMASEISSQVSSQMSAQFSEFKLHMSQLSKISTELSSKLDAQLKRSNVEYRKVETDEDEVHQIDEKEIAETAEDQSDVIKEMLVEEDQSVIIDNEDGDGDGDVIKYEDYNAEAEKTHMTSQLEMKKTNATLSSAVVSNETANEEDADAVDETENDDDADDVVSSSAIELVEDNSRASGEEKESIPLAKHIRVNVEVNDSLDAEQSEKPLSQPKTNSSGRRLWDRGKSKLFTWRDWLNLGGRTWCLIGTIRLKRRAVLQTRTFAKRLIATTLNE